MHQQTDSLFYRFRFVSAGLFTVVFLVLISAVVTVVGSHTIVDAQSTSASDVLDMSTPDNPNVILDSTYGLINSTRRVTLSTGTALYGGCRSITTLTAQSGRSIVSGSASTLRGIGSGTAFITHGVSRGAVLSIHTAASVVTFPLKAPGKLVSSIARGHAVSAIIQPTTDKPAPIISNETSAAVLARLSAQQQQEIASLQTGQLVANRNLGGAAVAGDPKHGGYPAVWDYPSAQDSHLDSWGMYNRECVSYAAWKVYQTYGHMPYWGGVGNASQWVGDARAAGIPTGSTPQVHSVAISMRGYYGHATWVEAISGDMIYVSQYNYGLDGHYSEMWVHSSSLTYIYFK